MTVYPTQLTLHDAAVGAPAGSAASMRNLVIVWSDGSRRRYGVRQLRDACPCATCREKRDAPTAVNLLPVLSPQELQPLAIAGMKPVGNYAYTIAFSDGHDTGIFSFERLLELGEPA
jgi:DUF971 family protein